MASIARVTIFSALLQFFLTLPSSCSPVLEKRFDYVGATSDVEQGSGPNGSEDWFNTGMDGDGWNPPYMGIGDVQHISLNDFYAGAGSGCQQFDGYFQAAASQNGIDPVFLAVIAMQESSCNPSATGPTPGLMQVACSNYPDDTNGCQTKCQNQEPVDGDCLQINVNAGAAFLNNAISSAGGNFIQAMGQYNGWFLAGSGLNDNKGITYSWPCSSDALGSGNGNQNVDYLQQVLNGWLQGINVYNTDQSIGLYESQYGTCGT